MRRFSEIYEMFIFEFLKLTFSKKKSHKFRIKNIKNQALFEKKVQKIFKKKCKNNHFLYQMLPILRWRCNISEDHML